MTTALVPVFSGTIQNSDVTLCDARTLHAFMEVRRDFSNWIKGRISKYGFVQDVDYLSISRSPDLANGKRGAAIDYHLTLDMAKELAMVENNQKGREARRYFIECERQALQALPPATLSTEQAYQIKKAVEARCMGNSAKFRTLYTRLYDAFHVSRYRDIAASDFERAIAFIEQWQPPRGFDPAITCDNPQPQPPVMPANPFGERLRWEIIDEGDGTTRCRLLDADHHLIKYKNLPRIISDPNSELPYIVIRELLDACVDRMEQIITNSNAACDLLRTQLRRERGLN